MPENNKRKQGGKPAVSSRARVRTHAGAGGRAVAKAGAQGTSAKKRRASRTVEFDKVGGSAPRIMKRPKPRRRPSQVTAQFGAVSPRRVKKKSGVSEFTKKTKERIDTVKVRGARLPWPVLATALCCTVVVMAMVLNYVRLNELTNRYRALQDETVQLISDRKRLTLTLEQKNDLIEFEEQAKRAGMVLSDRVEKRYIRAGNEDKIVAPEEEPNPIVKFFSELWKSVTDAVSEVAGGQAAEETGESGEE